MFNFAVRGVRAFALFACALISLHAHGASVVYEPDAAGRLKRATFSDGTIVDYTYDDNGNRTGQIVTIAPPDTEAPGAPGAPRFSNLTMTSVTAEWTTAEDNVGVASYEYRLNSGEWLRLGHVFIKELTGLSAGTNYHFEVRARDAAENPGPASAGSFKTPDTEPPGVPPSLSGSAPNSATVNLSWGAATDNVGVVSYRVFRNGTEIGTTTQRTYSDTGRSGSTAYSYVVRAYDKAGNASAPSNTLNITTPDTIKPSTPTGLSASSTNPTLVDLSWNASSDSGGSGLAGYRVYRNGTHIKTTTARTYSDTPVSANTTYSYRVAAYDQAGNASAQSTADSVTTPRPVTASVNSTTWSWLYQLGQPVRIYPSTIVVTASGGMGGYSYAWQRVSGDTQTTVNSPTSSSTAWSRSVPSYHVDYVSVWRCRVTDSAGNTGYTPNITVKFRAENFD